jgi:hypothetical protein
MMTVSPSKEEVAAKARSCVGETSLRRLMRCRRYSPESHREGHRRSVRIYGIGHQGSRRLYATRFEPLQSGFAFLCMARRVRWHEQSRHLLNGPTVCYSHLDPRRNVAEQGDRCGMSRLTLHCFGPKRVQYQMKSWTDQARAERGCGAVLRCGLW